MVPLHHHVRGLYVIPHLVYYQLAILALLWLRLMLPNLWPSPPGGAPKTPTQPSRPQRKRSTEPKPFAGLTHKPHCGLCEQEIEQLYGVQPHHLLLCDALGLNHSGYEAPSAQKNGTDIQTP